MRPRPSPERLDSQIKSLNQSQASLFKMVLDRNEELILINGKMMDELRDNNSQLKVTTPIPIIMPRKTLENQLLWGLKQLAAYWFRIMMV